MKEFFMHAMGLITIFLMTASVLYTWSRINTELKQLKQGDKQKAA